MSNSFSTKVINQSFRPRFRAVPVRQYVYWHRCNTYSTASERSRIINENPTYFSPFRNDKYEKIASATSNVIIVNRETLYFFNTDRYHRLNVISVAFSPNAFYGCTALSIIASLISAFTKTIPRISSPGLIAEAQTDHKRSILSVFFQIFTHNLDDGNHQVHHSILETVYGKVHVETQPVGFFRNVCL